MDGTGPQRPLTDAQLDRELASALGVEPSPEFLARVRTRLADEPRMELWRLAIRRWTFEPLAGLAVIGILLAVVVPRFTRNEERRVERVAAKPADVPLRERVEEPSPVTGARMVVPVARVQADLDVGLSQESGAIHTLPLQLSPVMFSEEDRIAFASFVTAVGDGRVPEKVVQSLGEEDMTPLAIAPLVINPLPPLARMERQGEGQW
jgi:hypothetical protein